MKINVGLNEDLRNHPQITFTNNIEIIDNKLTLFFDIKENKFYLQSNNKLFKENNGVNSLDDFSHEQSLIVKEEGKNILISGCSHTEIVYIIEKGMALIDKDFDVVIGGFHLYNPVTMKKEKAALINCFTSSLLSYISEYSTCHCTEKSAYKKMKVELKEQLHYLSARSGISI